MDGHNFVCIGAISKLPTCWYLHCKILQGLVSGTLSYNAGDTKDTEVDIGYPLLLECHKIRLGGFPRPHYCRVREAQMSSYGGPRLLPTSQIWRVCVDFVHRLFS